MQKRTKHNTNKINWWFWGTIIVIVVIILSLLLIASFEDLNIDKGLYQKKGFGAYTSCVAGFVFYFAMIITSACLVSKQLLLMKKRKIAKWLGILMAIVVFLGLLCLNSWNFKDSFLYSVNDAVTVNHPNFKFPWKDVTGYWLVIQLIVCTLVSATLLILFTFGSYKIMTRANFKIDQGFIFKWALWAIVFAITITLIVSTAKGLIPRARFYAMENGKIPPINNDKYGAFRPWYSLLWNPSPGTAGVSEYTSFPSSTVVWGCAPLIFIPIILEWTKNKTKRIVWISSIATFVIYIMLARLNAGRHYLSDVTITALINLSAYGIGWVAFKHINILRTTKQ